MILLRTPESIYTIGGEVQNGTFSGRWHFSFGQYRDKNFSRFGTLRVFNDDTLSPGAVWPLHPHNDIEVVTYCAQGEFRHADEKGRGGVLKKGDVQHTTVGTGMWHSEINNLEDAEMRFIQMWFYPSKKGLKPSVEQRQVEVEERTDRLLPVVSRSDKDSLNIYSDAAVYSSRLRKGRTVKHMLEDGRGAYIYALEGGPLYVNGVIVPALGAVMVKNEREIHIRTEKNAELLLVEVGLTGLLE